MNNEELKGNLLSSRHWLRLVFMLLFAAIIQLAGIIMWVVVGLQFLFSLITGQSNVNLRGFGFSLSTYIYQILSFLTYNSEEKPFPFSDWPSVDAVIVEEVVVDADVVEPAGVTPVINAEIIESEAKEDGTGNINKN